MKPKLRKFPLIVAAACAVLGQAAHAETVLPAVVVTEKLESGGSYEAAQSSAATKIAVPLRDVPQAVNVVPKAVMRDQNALSVQDALQNVPGLGFSVGDGQRDQVTIRGFSAINDQFVDGVRDDALYFRDLSNIERIEVLKGPSSVLYGRGSAGGLINRVTKKPRAEPALEIGATLGSAGQKRGEFDLGTASSDKETLFRLTGALEDSTSFRNQYFLERQVIAPSVTFKLRPQTTLTLQADYLKDKRLADQGVPSFRGRPVDVPIETYFGAANGRDRAFVQSEVASGTITLDHAFNAGLKLHSVLRGYDYSLDRNYTTIGKVTTTANPTVTIAQTRRLRDEQGYYFQNELSQKAQWGDTQHQLLYGLELGRQNKSEQLASRNNVATYNLFNPVLANLAPLPATIVPSADNQNRVNIAALYLQDLVTLSPQWKVLGGLRYDKLEQTRDDRTARNVDMQRTDNTLSPRIGAVYQPTEQVSVYAGYSRSFQPLSDSFVFRANSDQLKPTQTENKEVGVKLDIGAKASLSAAVFDMSQTNIQVADPANPNFSIPVGKQRTRGLELAFAGEVAPQWEIISGYSYMKGSITESTELTSAGTPFQGNTAALTPRHSLNLWLKRKFNERYYVAAGGRAESSRYASPDNLTVLPGYGVINLGAGYEEKKFDVAVTLKNLLNRKYFAAAHSGANDYNMPGEPRSLLVSARYRF
ncbi:TonB-dependent siderophore receptor [Polaromonas sp.]|uniref:TonB-dependent receptor n=1 Tax=Polaromonas sp. TaxID=1869339 RepID=UPI0017AFE935|nr:TonB-dependent siderophore receptor [Polaromonas sp.]NMM08442.1 TonB-dependent siderophore receptor [Polaromonas sp.]